MQPAAQFRLLSNRSPEKSGLQQLKKANPCPRFTPFEFWLQTNIQNDFATNPHQIAEVIANCAVYIKIMISQIIENPTTNIGQASRASPCGLARLPNIYLWEWYQ